MDKKRVPDMESLCKDIVAAHENRKGDIQTLGEETEAIRERARKFLSDSKKLHKKMAKDLRKSLEDNREALIKNVNAIREDFKRKEKEIREDLAEASKIWSEMNKTLKMKKTALPKALARKRGEIR